jgi:ABC-type sulfate/molybdate transport systems ATPase subunit
MDTKGFLDAVAVTKNYTQGVASGVNNVTLSIQPGKITAIVGESGSGKSTLLRLFYGLLDPDNGEVRFKNEMVMGPVEKLIPGHDRMKMVTQHTDDLNLFANVGQNVSTLLPNTNLEYKHSETDRLLRQLKIYHLKQQRIFDLSGGEKQRVAIARALITKPEILFLDEPFNQVDASFREGLQQNIREIVKETGLTVVMVSHDPAEVLSMADTMVVVKDGEIVESGTPQEMYNNPKILYTAQLLSHCSVLTREQALLCGITSKMDWIGINPEYVALTTGTDWVIRQVLFKGFYEELVLQCQGVELRMINAQKGMYKTSQPVGVKIDKYWEYS